MRVEHDGKRLVFVPEIFSIVIYLPCGARVIIGIPDAEDVEAKVKDADIPENVFRFYLATHEFTAKYEHN